MLLTLKPYKYNKCVTYRILNDKHSLIDDDDAFYSDELPTDYNLYPNNEADFLKATYYEIIREGDKIETIGYITGYRIYGREIHFEMLSGGEHRVFFEFDDISQILADFYSAFVENLSDNIYLLTSFTLIEEYSNNSKIINSILEMVNESNREIYGFDTDKIISTVGNTEVHDDTIKKNKNDEFEGVNGFIWLVDELYVPELGFVEYESYLIKDYNEEVDFITNALEESVFTINSESGNDIKKVRLTKKEIENVIFCLNVTLEYLENIVECENEKDNNIYLEETNNYKNLIPIFENKLSNKTGATFNMDSNLFYTLFASIEFQLLPYIKVEQSKSKINIEDCNKDVVQFVSIYKKLLKAEGDVQAEIIVSRGIETNVPYLRIIK